MIPTYGYDFNDFVSWQTKYFVNYPHLVMMKVTTQMLFLRFRELGSRQIWKKLDKFRHILEGTI